MDKNFNDPLELKIAIFVLVSHIMVLHFVYKKDFWDLLVKFILYKASLSSSRSNKKHFQLADFNSGILVLLNKDKISELRNSEIWFSLKIPSHEELMKN